VPRFGIEGERRGQRRQFAPRFAENFRRGRRVRCRFADADEPVLRNQADQPTGTLAQPGRADTKRGAEGE
jgi:hypothetical protein